MEKITTGDALTKSKDLIAENIERLKELFPEVTTEGKVDFKVLQQILGEELEEEEEYYRFTWAGKSQARMEAHKPSTGTLRPVKEESVDWDATKNLYIEGDNLEVLKLLQKSYAGKIDLIYIDPPYNTGKDFVYKDNYKDNLRNYQEITGQVDSEGKRLTTNTESEGQFHSNWLNMIYPRLRLARNLLSNQGVIFISIDNHEIQNLTNVCNEIFGEENFLSQFIWRNGRTSASVYTNEHEYILAYAKNQSKVSHIKYSGEDSEISDRAIKKVGQKNPASEISFKKGMRFEGSNQKFPKVFGDSEVVEITKGELECKDGKLSQDVTIRAGWVMKDMIESWINGEEVFDSKGQRVTEFFFKSNGVLQYVKERGTIHPKTIIEGISTKQGSNEVNSIFGAKVFDYPKPVSLIEFLLPIAKDDSIILDFFSGSASSAQAVLQQNAVEGKIRQFINVQLPEPIDQNSEGFKAGYKTISALGIERIKRAAKIIAKENPDKVKDLDLGFKVFKLDSSNIRPWDGNPEHLENDLFNSQDNIKADRTPEDVLFEVLLKYGLDLTLPIEERALDGQKVFNVGHGALFVCLDEKIKATVADAIGKWKEEVAPEVCRVIFRDAGFDDVEKTNATQILKRYGITEVKSI